MTKDPRAFFAWDVVAQTMFPPPYARFIRLEKRYLASHNWPLPPGFLQANAIHQMYHLCRFQAATGLAIRDFDFILEFGGGYGEMCRVVPDLGFAGRYLIFDLPETNALQRYCLRGCCVELQSATPQEDPAPGSRKVFIATWSFDEAPLEARAPWTALLAGFDAFLIAYQSNFAGIDNEAFFLEWQRHFPRIRWTTHVIPQLKDSFYLFGAFRP